MALRVCVVGGTGAIGKHVVGELLLREEVASVTTAGRRDVELPEPYKDLQSSSKLHQVTIDFENLQEETFRNHDAVLCALGTTRRDAGSAEAFRRIDFTFVHNIAKLCKSAGVPHFSLVSSAGANANSFFLYMKTKGEIEEAVKELQFPSLSIFRPGLLDRGENRRTVEKIAMFFTKGMRVQTVAQAMVVDVLRKATAPGVTAAFDNNGIRQLAGTLETLSPPASATASTTATTTQAATTEQQL